VSTTPIDPSIERDEQTITGPPPPPAAEHEPEPPPPEQEPVEDRKPVDLGRMAWLVTVGVCLVTVAVLLAKGYAGYALVTLAVALSAAVNLR
jgi:hypothetical protein